MLPISLKGGEKAREKVSSEGKGGKKEEGKLLSHSIALSPQKKRKNEREDQCRPGEGRGRGKRGGKGVHPIHFIFCAFSGA